jgi:DNA polymerase-3 subunit delta'
LFEKISGHNDLRNTLAALIDKQGVFLFHGPPSVGKRTIAHTIARYDLCCGDKGDDCSCKSCRIIEHGHPDLLQIGKSGKVLVEDIDALIEFSVRAPLISKTKIVVVDFVEGATTEAANRLLKTLEESLFSFFLISSDISKVLPTIVSRSFVVKFESLSSDDIATLMMGRFGFDALSARTLGWIGSSLAVDIFASAGICLKCRDMACEFISTIRDLLKSLDFLDRLDKASIGIFCDMLVMVLTDLLFLKNGLLDIINADKRDVLQKMAKQLNDVAIVTSLSFLTQVKKYSYLNVNLGLSLKIMVIKVHPILSQ